MNIFDLLSLYWLIPLFYNAKWYTTNKCSETHFVVFFRCCCVLSCMTSCCFELFSWNIHYGGDFVWQILVCFFYLFRFGCTFSISIQYMLVSCCTEPWNCTKHGITRTHKDSHSSDCIRHTKVDVRTIFVQHLWINEISRYVKCPDKTKLWNKRNEQSILKAKNKGWERKHKQRFSCWTIEAETNSKQAAWQYIVVRHCYVSYD